jgi:hypothetical protein
MTILASPRTVPVRRAYQIASGNVGAALSEGVWDWYYSPAFVATHVAAVGQDWFWAESWQRGEREAEVEISKGLCFGPFASVDEMKASFEVWKEDRPSRKSSGTDA